MIETRQIRNEQDAVTPNHGTQTHSADEKPHTENLLMEIKSLRARMAGLERLESEHERIEQALMKALQEWEATFNATRDAIMLVDKNFTIVQANHSASRFFGKPLAKIIGQTIHGLLYGTDLPPDNCPLVTASHTNKHEESELYIPQKDTWVAVSADPVIDDEGKTECLVHIIRDITYRKKTEQTLEKLNTELHQSVNELKKSNQELRNFAHVTAHDLKSPLRGIGSIADRLLRNYSEKLDNSAKEQLGLLFIRVKRMSDFIDGILRYSEIGHVTEDRQNIDVNALLAEIIAEMAVSENCKITIEQPLPILLFERPRLKQIFQNLLSNAIKYSDKPSAEVKISCSEDNDFWKFSVADNGCGIKEQYFEKIFEIFQTLTSRDKTESTGIGLTIVKKIVELYGGNIWVESKIGQGSTFFFALPKINNVRT